MKEMILNVKKYFEETRKDRQIVRNNNMLLKAYDDFNRCEDPRRRDEIQLEIYRIRGLIDLV